ncbi:MAG: hypothetical protein EOP52_00835 [Sphingobacteriales bacterium]|nr:MAG: hypothetical protein EOP52_00835 [Sphingobacteriales bacterium]
MRPIIRKNMHSYTSLIERQIATESVIDILTTDLLNGWNPITHKDPPPVVIELSTEPEPVKQVATGPEPTMARALAYAIIKRYKYRKRRVAENGAKRDKVLADVCGYVRRFLEVAKRLGKHSKPIATVRRRDVLEIMEQLAEEREWKYASWNNCMAYLSALWTTLIKYEVTEINPTTGIDDWTSEPKSRKMLTEAQRGQIKDHLAKVAPAFLRAGMIFFASGGREEEMCRIQGKDVKLENQEFTAEIREGKAGWRRVTKAITDAALPYW